MASQRGRESQVNTSDDRNYDDHQTTSPSTMNFSSSSKSLKSTGQKNSAQKVPILNRLFSTIEPSQDALNQLTKQTFANANISRSDPNAAARLKISTKTLPPEAPTPTSKEPKIKAKCDPYKSVAKSSVIESSSTESGLQRSTVDSETNSTTSRPSTASLSNIRPVPLTSRVRRPSDIRRVPSRRAKKTSRRLSLLPGSVNSIMSSDPVPRPEKVIKEVTTDSAKNEVTKNHNLNSYNWNQQRATPRPKLPEGGSTTKNDEELIDLPNALLGLLMTDDSQDDSNPTSSVPTGSYLKGQSSTKSHQGGPGKNDPRSEMGSSGLADGQTGKKQKKQKKRFFGMFGGK